MSDTISLPPSYQEPSSSGPSANAHRELLVQGAEEPGTVTFSDYAASRTPSYRLVRNDDGRVDLIDVTRAETIYTVQAEPNSKVFTATRLTTSPDSTDSTPATTSVKPEKISRAGGFIYKASFPNPHLEGTRCVWKGSIFQSVELYAKDAAGRKTPIALYIRKSGGDHFLRLYPTASSSSTSNPSSSSSSAPFPSLPLILTTLYPFLQLYWKYTRKSFTSDKKLNEWSATAQPSRWDSRILGKAPGAKGKERSGGTGTATPTATAGAGAGAGTGVGGGGGGVHPSILPRNGNGNGNGDGVEGQGAQDDADGKTLLSSSDDEDGGGYDSDDDIKGGTAPGPTATATATETGNAKDEASNGGSRAGKSPSRLGKLFGRRGGE